MKVSIFMKMLAAAAVMSLAQNAHADAICRDGFKKVIVKSNPQIVLEGFESHLIDDGTTFDCTYSHNSGANIGHSVCESDDASAVLYYTATEGYNMFFQRVAGARIEVQKNGRMVTIFSGFCSRF